MTLMTIPAPDEDSLYRRIADKAPGTDADTVREILAGHGITLNTPLPSRRELVVHRLYCEGTKTGTDDNDGSFAVDVRLGPGAWALTSTHNSAGKSSLLWALSYALRGDGFGAFQRKDTVDWFTYIRADIEVSGVPASIRLTFDTPGKPTTRLLTAQTLEQLLALDPHVVDGDGVRTAATAAPGGAKDLIDRFMLERLGLRPISVWSAEKNAPKDADGHRNRDSAEQVHGWASYFYAVAMNNGNSNILLGPTITGQLPVRLMQLFLDVPYTSELTYLTTARKQVDQNDRRTQRRAAEDTQARRHQTEPLRQALAAAREHLAACEARQPDHTALLTDLQAAGHALVTAQEHHQDTTERHGTLRKMRLKDERDLRRARQSSAARLLLGALQPEACPRCDHTIDDTRRATEDTDHRCSLCTHPLAEVEVDPEAEAARLAALEERLKASTRAETTLDAGLRTAEVHLQRAREDYRRAADRLEQVRTHPHTTDTEQARRDVHHLQDALAVATGTAAELPAAVGHYLTDTPGTRQSEDEPDDTEDRVLAAAATVVGDIVAKHSRTSTSPTGRVAIRLRPLDHSCTSTTARTTPALRRCRRGCDSVHPFTGLFNQFLRARVFRPEFLFEDR
jgi:hypothetical protein